MFFDCPYCHKSVFWLLVPWHIRKHTKLLPDGQMTDHITKPEVARYEGSLEGVPRVYEHRGCGGITGMPEQIVRSYLVDPDLYSDHSFCAGCGKYVHTSKLFWLETNESLLDYNRRLRLDLQTEDRST